MNRSLSLAHVLELYSTSGLLRFAPLPRSLASLFWACEAEKDGNQSLQRRARSLSRLRSSFAHSPAIAAFTQELGTRIGEFCATIDIQADPEDAHMAGSYLFEELSQEPLQFAMSEEARRLLKAFSAHLTESGSWRDFEEDLKALQDDLSNRYRLASAWLTAFLDQSDDEHQLINEAYLPLIGDNLAKQIGALGESKRTDLMGLLLLISPPATARRP